MVVQLEDIAIGVLWLEVVELVIVELVIVELVIVELVIVELSKSQPKVYYRRL